MSEVAQSCSTLREPIDWTVACQARTRARAPARQEHEQVLLPGKNTGKCSCQARTRASAPARQEHWSGVPFPSPGDRPDPGIEPGLLTLWADFSLTEPFPIKLLLFYCDF